MSEDVGELEDMDVDLDEDERDKVILLEKYGQTWVQDVVFCIPDRGIAIGNNSCEFIETHATSLHSADYLSSSGCECIFRRVELCNNT